MIGITNFIKNLIVFAICLAAAGTLAEATGCVGREAVLAHKRGGISFQWLNHQLQRSDHR
jgi:hypothetical protein